MVQDLPKILIVDDRPENLYALEKLLKNLNVKVVQATSGAEALDLSLVQDFCVAIVDIQMPEMDGYELVELLRSNEGTNTMPVIFVSAIFSDEYHHRKGYEAGAVDFLSKPFVPEILLSKVKIFIELYQQRNAERQRRRLAESLEHVGRSLASSLNFKEVPFHILEQLYRLVPYERGSVLLRQENQLKVLAQRGFPSDWNSETLIPIRQGDVFHQIATSRSPLMVDDVTQNAGWQQQNVLPVHRSWIGAPLLAQGQVVGIMSLTRQEIGQFTAEDMMLVWAFAGQAAIALENSRLYDQLARFNNELESLVRQRTQELENANQSLARADKIKSDFINVAAHELRTPLTLIRGYTDLLKGMVNDKAEAAPIVEGIQNGERRMLDVVNSMLDISRIENQVLNVAKEQIQLPGILVNVKDVFAEALQKRQISLDLSGVNGLPATVVDPDLMHKLFYQLFSNAIKYTPDGGKVMVSGSLVPASEKTNGRAMVEITVRDSGIGIDPAFHEMIFEKFFQTGQVKLHSTSRTNFKGGGPGLGLTIARGIVQAHGGLIWVESPGCDEETCPGSCFHVLLPVNGAK
jgi:signal transduction histidine kinase/FixJ family two-component response regulator